MARPRKADARPDSRTAILEAAAREFAERGFDGTRMEHVANRAGFNKSLVYKHFTDREGLFKAVLDAQFAQRRAFLRQLPETLGETLVWWSQANLKDPSFGKLIMREALDYRGAQPVRAEERRAYYQRQIDMVAGLQKKGVLPPHLEPKYLFLALLAVVSLPAFLPQIAALVTGDGPDSAAIRDGWHRFLRGFADSLGARDDIEAFQG